jgi:hypothetical protein
MRDVRGVALVDERTRMKLSRIGARGILASVAALILLGAPRPASSQFVSMTANPRAVLEGNWQSCLEPETGRHAERVYDHVVNGVGEYEVHLGPRREFAIFAGVQDEHRDHSSPGNLLQPFRVVIEGERGSQRWEVPSLNLVFTATLGGGSSSACESWYILLEPLKKTS